jgi:hypothetical protein
VLVTSTILSLPLQKREGFEYGAFALPLTKGKGWEGVSSYDFASLRILMQSRSAYWTEGVVKSILLVSC